MKSWRDSFGFLTLLLLIASPCCAQTAAFTPPQSLRVTLCFDPDWKFIRQDVAGAEAVNFDDSKWTTVSTPHTFNDVDSYRNLITHTGGDSGVWTGVVWYRKHFKLPIEYADRKVFIEFEGMRQAGKIFLNGKQIGLDENGITAYGIDLTGLVNLGDNENVLAVQVDNRLDYKEQATATPFEWNVNHFNPNYGGINKHVWLHVTGKFYQTLPLFYGLQSSGVYVYPNNFNFTDNTCDVTVEAQVSNETNDRGTANLSAVVVDDNGQVRATLTGDDSDMVNGEKDILKVTGTLKNAHFWSTHQPYLYDVYCVLTVNNKLSDVCKIRTGFRKVEFKGGAGKGGVFINDQFVYLKGYAQRSTDDWAGLGQAYPDWMHDLNTQIVRDSNANYMRWMHIAPARADVTACDRYGIVDIVPAGDQESDAKGRQWDQRMEVMRDSIIYFRNDPSVLFWEAGNNGVSAAHMQQMKDVKAEYDPYGMRAMGCRTLSDPASTTVAEYFGAMIGQTPRTDQLQKPTDVVGGYSLERRELAPIIEAEDFRDEAARRYWDDFSPPFLGFKPGPQDVYRWNSETFCLAAATRYWAYYSERISNPDPKKSKWSGYASIFFFDSNSDGRQASSEVARASGKVDAVRLPKEAFYTYQVMQSEVPAIHIIGHWTYPEKTVKTMYVISNCQSVELLVNGKSLGKNSKPKDGYVFAFPAVAWETGTIKAIGSNDGKPVAQHELTTAGAPAALKLTPMFGPPGFLANGADVAVVDVEVVDAQGRRCPTDEARVDFAVTGPAIWRGGYNSGKINSTNNLYLDSECGINRVAIRSTLTPGTITLTATRQGLTQATMQIESKPEKITDGTTDTLPARFAPPDSVMNAQ